VSDVRIVLDSTVLISRFLTPVPGGPAFDLLEHVRRGACDAFVSRDILEEVRDVLLRSRIRRRYKFDDQDVEEYNLELMQIATVLDPKPTVRVVRDRNDDMVLDCAVAADADYVITRDHDLLSLASYGDVKIVKPEEFLEILRRRGR
jgi:uncharacterized protein